MASKILRNLVNLVAGAAISLSLSCSGASTTVIKSQDLEGVLQQYFTEKAQKALRDIPVYLIDPPQSGECAETLEGIGGFVMYPDFEWNTEILRDKCDVDVPKGRKIILVRDASEKALIHEYLHQADGLKLLSDLYAYAVFDRFFFEHDAENKGPASELIKQVYDKTPDEKVAYLGAEVALGADVPAYVHCAYRNVLKISAARTKIYKKPFNSETPYYWNTLPVDFRRCGGIP